MSFSHLIPSSLPPRRTILANVKMHEVLVHPYPTMTKLGYALGNLSDLDRFFAHHHHISRLTRQMFAPRHSTNPLVPLRTPVPTAYMNGHVATLVPQLLQGVHKSP